MIRTINRGLLALVRIGYLTGNTAWGDRKNRKLTSADIKLLKQFKDDLPGPQFQPT